METEGISKQAIAINEESNVEYVTNAGLHFEDGRIYAVELHQKPGKGKYSVKKDVTEEILDTFLRILRKRESAAKQDAIIRQLMMR